MAMLNNQRVYICVLAAGFPYVRFCVFAWWGGVGWGGLITFNGTCTHRWCYVTDLVSCTCRHTWCYATDLVSCTCRHTWCYATDLVACTCTHRWCYATDLVSCTCMMGWGGVGWGGLITFNGTCRHTWCYVTDLVSCTCRHTWWQQSQCAYGWDRPSLERPQKKCS